MKVTKVDTTQDVSGGTKFVVHIEAGSLPDREIGTGTYRPLSFVAIATKWPSGWCIGDPMLVSRRVLKKGTMGKTLRTERLSSVLTEVPVEVTDWCASKLAKLNKTKG